MLAHPTHERLIALGLPGMAKAFEDQRRSPDIAALSFEERLGLMVDREAAERDAKRLATRLKFAALRQNAVSPPCGRTLSSRTSICEPARHRPGALPKARRGAPGSTAPKDC